MDSLYWDIFDDGEISEAADDDEVPCQKCNNKPPDKLCRRCKRIWQQRYAEVYGEIFEANNTRQGCGTGTVPESSSGPAGVITPLTTPDFPAFTLEATTSHRVFPSHALPSSRREVEPRIDGMRLIRLTSATDYTSTWAGRFVDGSGNGIFIHERQEATLVYDECAAPNSGCIYASRDDGDGDVQWHHFSLPHRSHYSGGCHQTRDVYQPRAPYGNRVHHNYRAYSPPPLPRRNLPLYTPPRPDYIGGICRATPPSLTASLIGSRGHSRAVYALSHTRSTSLALGLSCLPDRGPGFLKELLSRLGIMGSGASLRRVWHTAVVCGTLACYLALTSPLAWWRRLGLGLCFWPLETMSTARRVYRDFWPGVMQALGVDLLASIDEVDEPGWRTYTREA